MAWTDAARKAALEARRRKAAQRPVTLYHGTSLTDAQGIEREGLKVMRDRRNNTSSLYAGRRARSVFVTKSYKEARLYAMETAKRQAIAAGAPLRRGKTKYMFGDKKFPLSPMDVGHANAAIVKLRVSRNMLHRDISGALLKKPTSFSIRSAVGPDAVVRVRTFKVRYEQPRSIAFKG